MHQFCLVHSKSELFDQDLKKNWNPNPAKTRAGFLRIRLCLVLHGYARFATSAVQLMVKKYTLNFDYTSWGAGGRRFKSSRPDQLNPRGSFKGPFFIFVYPAGIGFRSPSQPALGTTAGA
jgi:hypothetical protein